MLQEIGLTLSTPRCLPRHHGAGLSVNSVSSQPQLRGGPTQWRSQADTACCTDQTDKWCMDCRSEEIAKPFLDVFPLPPLPLFGSSMLVVSVGVSSLWLFLDLSK